MVGRLLVTVGICWRINLEIRIILHCVGDCHNWLL